MFILVQQPWWLMALCSFSAAFFVLYCLPISATGLPLHPASLGRAVPNLVSETLPPSILADVPKNTKPTETATLCIIGGGVSGLAAAITAVNNIGDAKIVLLEASSDVGGRVQTDQTCDGFALDRGFAVFIEEYPMAKQLLDYDQLRLGQFLPGALIRLPNKVKLARLSDPLRRPSDLLSALLSPIGSISDKIKLVPLIWNVRRKSIADLFDEPETTTAEALKQRWRFSDDMLDSFFRPFFEGIFLSPLEEQSSRMFSFVFKMFSEGSATLPAGGIVAVANQLGERAVSKGVDIRTDHIVARLSQADSGSFVVETTDGKCRIQANTVIVATDVDVSRKLLSQLDCLEFLKEDSCVVEQRSVGCIYYSFQGEPPVKDPILILNGEGKERDPLDSPINNVCFPSAVTTGYAPDGFGLCSVAILKGAIDAYRGNEEDLDRAVRIQLAAWFPDFQKEILEKWKLQRIYYVPNAQPVQLGKFPASVNGGRDCSTVQGRPLPSGMFVCGDHMATASLNGALESGVNAGTRAAQVMANAPR
jgi:phytoene dehydrogenase-like protein